MSKRIITERMIIEAFEKGGKPITIDEATIVTPAAKDKAKQLKIKLLSKREVLEKSTSSEDERGFEDLAGNRIVAIGSDHGGFQMKETLKKFLVDLGYKVTDVGTNSEEPCDYPDFAYEVAKAVAEGEAWRAIMIDGAGIGSAMVANKVPNVRAACCHNEFVARNSREHNNANVLTLGSRVIGIEVAKEIVKIWLDSLFAGGRHKKRVGKIKDIERKFLKNHQ